MQLLNGLALYFVSLVMFIAFPLCASQLMDVIGCGGFVEASAELAKVMKTKMDYSNIRIELTTLEGAVKEATECAPNGYYFLPVYDRGTYRLRLRGPEGWHFEPRELRVSISDDNKCNDGRDINFCLTGFTVSGTVLGCGGAADAQPPAGVAVRLARAEAASVAIATTTTDERGHYAFVNVAPGRYVISASHASWTFSVATASVEVAFGNVAVSTPLVVGGYAVSGVVTDARRASQPVGGVDFKLFASGDMSTPVATAQSAAANGRFVFAGVPCGRFRLVAEYKSAAATFDIAPAAVDIIVTGRDVDAGDFLVAGFAASGRVVDADGRGVSGVAIAVGGVDRGVTDSDGRYRLEGMTSSRVVITAKHDHMVFAPLTAEISPSAPALPDIAVTRVHLCGRVVIDVPPPAIGTALPREVQLRNGNGEISRTTTDAAGNFCFAAAPKATYALSPVVSRSENAAGLVLVPTVAEVAVASSPVVDVIFSQTRARVAGAVRCLETPCDSSVAVVLEPANAGAPRVTTGLLGGGGVGDEDAFVFRDVLPGKYRVAVSQEAYCWEEKAVEIVVDRGDIDDIEFVHTGYVAAVAVSHGNISLYYEWLGGQHVNGTVEIPTKGTHRFCLPRAGAYMFRPIGCVRFEREVYRFDTASPRVIEMTPTAFRIDGSAVAMATADPATVWVNVTLGEAPVAITTLPTTRTADTYAFSHWAAVGDTLTFTPFSDSLLFYPASRTVTIATAECPPPLPPFEARPGLWIRGRIDPILAGVRVAVRDRATGAVVMATDTDANGRYAAGPLYDDREYDVDATKAEYRIAVVADSVVVESAETGRRERHVDFRAMKLGRLVVTVTTTTAGDGGDVALSGAVVSLSGSGGYRSNAATQPPSGTAVFTELSPGEYFAKPMLKEYMFEPPSVAVTVTEGGEVAAAFKARRVAYSVYGNVRYLNGEPEKQVVVEATGANGEHEETISDANGDYRLRGLVPGNRYQVRVKPAAGGIMTTAGGEPTANARLERATPASTAINMSTADIRGIDFIVFRKSNKVDITGRVALTTGTPAEHLATLHAELLALTAADAEASRVPPSATVVRRIGPLGPVNFFDFHGIAIMPGEQRFALRLTTTLSTRDYTINTPTEFILPPLDSLNIQAAEEEQFLVNVDTIAPSVFYVELPFRATLKPAPVELAAAPFWVLILGVMAVTAGMNWKRTVEIAKSMARGEMPWKRTAELREEEQPGRGFLPKQYTDKKPKSPSSRIRKR